MTIALSTAKIAVNGIEAVLQKPELGLVGLLN
jgi:hypothetical protein